MDLLPPHIYGFGTNHDPPPPPNWFGISAIGLLCILKIVSHPYQIVNIFLDSSGEIETGSLSFHFGIAHTLYVYIAIY